MSVELERRASELQIVSGSHLCIGKLIFKTQTGEMLRVDRKG